MHLALTTKLRCVLKSLVPITENGNVTSFQTVRKVLVLSLSLPQQVHQRILLLLHQRPCLNAVVSSCLNICIVCYCSCDSGNVGYVKMFMKRNFVQNFPDCIGKIS